MRGVFSGLALILVLVVVGFTAMKQLKNSVPVVVPGSAASGTSGSASAPAAALQQSKQIAQDINKALEQGAARNEEAMK
ncbi:MAG: hypothetical protein ACOVOX_15755 [Burkholderiaceae bacterium]